jgi:hypothetical protein
MWIQGVMRCETFGGIIRRRCVHPWQTEPEHSPGSGASSTSNRIQGCRYGRHCDSDRKAASYPGARGAKVLTSQDALDEYGKAGWQLVTQSYAPGRDPFHEYLKIHEEVAQGRNYFDYPCFAGSWLLAHCNASSIISAFQRLSASATS